jgi:predicted dehydrogenase
MSIRFGYIGCGIEARRHLPYLLAAGWEFAALYDPSDMANLALGVTPKRCGTVKDFFNELIDVVCIFSPDRTHTPYLAQAVGYGKHVFCEKPLATDYEQLILTERAFITAKQKGLVLMSCHPTRFYPAVEWLQRELPHFIAAMGPVKRFDYQLNLPKPAAGWRGQGHSFLLDHLCHELDLMSFLFGDSEVKARSYEDTFDAYAVSGLRTSDRITFSLTGRRQLDVPQGQRFDKQISLAFECGHVDILDAIAGVALIRNTQALLTESARFELVHIKNELSTYAGRMAAFDGADKAITDNFIRCVEGRAEPYIESGTLLTNLGMLIKLHVKGMC